VQLVNASWTKSGKKCKFSTQTLEAATADEDVMEDDARDG